MRGLALILGSAPTPLKRSISGSRPMKGLALILGSTLALLPAAAASGCGSTGPGGSANSPATAGPGVGQPLPALSFKHLDGRTWRADSTRGSVVVLDVWATWCEPCKEAFPKLSALSRSHDDLVVVGISVDEEDAPVHEFLAQVPASFTIVRDPELTIRDSPLQVRQLPTVVIVDRQGVVRHRYDAIDAATYDAVADHVAALLAAP